MTFKRISVTKKSKSGRNEEFKDNCTQELMTAPEFITAIQNGDYPNYHVRDILGEPTPCSNPDDSTNNNLN